MFVIPIRSLSELLTAKSPLFQMAIFKNGLKVVSFKWYHYINNKLLQDLLGIQIPTVNAYSVYFGVVPTQSV